MATRSSIAIANPNGTITATYCNWGGYLEHNGKILMDHYSDEIQLQRLLDHGDISSLAPAIDPTPGSGHNFNNNEDGVTVFYGRDRGETGIDSTVYGSVTEWLDGHGQEYNYLFENGAWVVSDHGSEFRFLADAIRAEAEADA